MFAGEAQSLFDASAHKLRRFRASMQYLSLEGLPAQLIRRFGFVLNFFSGGTHHVVLLFTQCCHTVHVLKTVQGRILFNLIRGTP